MTTKIKTVLGLAGGLAIATALAPHAAQAIPAYPDGSLAFSTGVNGFTNTDGIDKVDATTTQIVVTQPGENFNPSTGNLNIPGFSSEIIGPSVGSSVTIAIPNHAVSLGTPLTMSVAGFSFAFDQEEPNGVPVSGNVGVKLTGHLLSSPGGFTPLPNQDADLLDHVHGEFGWRKCGGGLLARHAGNLPRRRAGARDDGGPRLRSARPGPDPASRTRLRTALSSLMPAPGFDPGVGRDPVTTNVCFRQKPSNVAKASTGVRSVIRLLSGASGSARPSRAHRP